jgi:hypothetical protein
MMIRSGPDRFRLVILALLILLAVPRPSYAYLDPGSASYTLQMVIALALSAAFVIKTYWSKLKRFVSGLFNPRSEKREDKVPESPAGDA